MALGWFKKRDVDAFADSLIEELAQRFPPAPADRGKALTPKRIQKTHRALFSRVDAFARATPLGVYAKARLANRVRWALADAGYEKAFVEAFAYEVAATLALASRKRLG